MLTTLTEQDVHDALFAQRTTQLAQTEKTTPVAIIHEMANDPSEVPAQLAALERGQALLRDYIVLMSSRSVAGGRLSDEQVERAVSPVVQVESGYIATSVAYRAVALAQR